MATHQYSCLGNPMDRETWQGNSPWGHKELIKTEQHNNTKIHTYIHIYIYTRAHIFICMYKNTYLYICMYAYRCVCIYIYIHTHAHIYIYFLIFVSIIHYCKILNIVPYGGSYFLRAFYSEKNILYILISATILVFLLPI